MAKLSWKQAFINAVDAYRNAKGTTDKIAVGSFPALLEEAIAGGGGGDEGVGGIVYNEMDSYGNITSATVKGSVVASYAFQNNSALTTIELPAELTKIGTMAFYFCSILKLTELPASVNSIAQSAFQNCRKLALTELPVNLTNIERYAFQNCTGLTELTFKGTPTSIVTGAFDGCTNLLTINVPWAEGEVANAPWGATNATINYNYTGE